MTDTAEPLPGDQPVIPLGPGLEFDRIRRILDRLGPIARGVGDDCAILPDGPGRLVVSVDLSIEGVHFRHDWLTLEEIGWRATAAALSDLAAEGAATIGVLTSIGVPSVATDDELTALMSGVGAAAHAAGGAVLGGDLTASKRWVIDVTVLGRALRPVTRVGAAPGDGLWVTGTLGGARAALHAWLAGGAPHPGARSAFAHPVPRIAAGQALARAGAHAMLDLSDGLGGDAEHLAAASGVALEIDLDLVPVAPAAIPTAVREGISPALFAAQGGEDYELLAALPADFDAAAAARLSGETGVALTRIGAVHSGAGTRFLLAGVAVALMGHDHFR
ncbi:MAG: thiamine-phosphate kinase [Gemmatimonadota bacterium]